MDKKTSYFLITLLFNLYFFNHSFSQSKDLRIVFYNVENLFDTLDNVNKRDNDFLKNGRYRWNRYKYFHKIKSLGKVLSNLANPEAPTLIGLAEVENRRVVDDLIHKSPLRKWRYKIAHFDSNDPRGIDVALVYRNDEFTLLSKKLIPISNDNGRNLRGVLYVKGRFRKNKDSIHILVNHWPSNYSGEYKGNEKRKIVVRQLKRHLDSISKHETNPKILLMGDFNTSPSDPVMLNSLTARRVSENINDNDLYNLMHEVEESGEGTYKLKREFLESLVLDHFIVSGNLLDQKSNYPVSMKKAYIFKPKWLFNKKGMPKRTHRGVKYEAGFSDHLPIYLDLRIE